MKYSRMATSGMQLWVFTLVVLGLTGCDEKEAPEQETQVQAEEISADADPVTASVEIFDDRALTVLHPDSRPTIRAENFLWTEGPVWIDDGSYLLFSDIPNNIVHRFDAENGLSDYLKPAGGVGLPGGDAWQGSNGLLLGPDGRLVLMQHGDRRVVAMDAPLDAPASTFVSLADSLGGARLNSPNDGVFDSNGNLYFTDPTYGLQGGLDDPRRELSHQGVYRLDVSGELSLLDDSVTFPNGIGVSTDETTLYLAVSDPEDARWLAYDLESDGSATNRRVLVDANAAINDEGLEGYPDGMAVHSSGLIFAAGPGGVWLISPDGDVLARILAGRLTSNCTLSADESMLYMTAHDTLMTLSLKTDSN